VHETHTPDARAKQERALKQAKHSTMEAQGIGNETANCAPIARSKQEEMQSELSTHGASTKVKGIASLSQAVSITKKAAARVVFPGGF